MPPPRLLLVFVAEPLPGRVLPRLAASTGEENAARIYQAMVHVLLRQLNGLTDCRLRFCFAPADADEAVRFWLLPRIIDDPALALDPGEIDFAPQGDGDQGERLQRAFDQGFAEGFEKIAVIGTDCIEVSSRWVHAAFAQLGERHDAAMGPCPGGSHHLIALQRPTPSLFREIPWSSPEAFATTLQRAADSAVRTYQLPPLTEIATEGDYKKALLGPLGPALRRAVKELR
jgi:rSAM/selenodomain-associated transferase 1